MEIRLSLIEILHPKLLTMTFRYLAFAHDCGFVRILLGSPDSTDGSYQPIFGSYTFFPENLVFDFLLVHWVQLVPVYLWVWAHPLECGVVGLPGPHP